MIAFGREIIALKRQWTQDFEVNFEEIAFLGGGGEGVQDINDLEKLKFDFFFIFIFFKLSLMLSYCISSRNMPCG